jgi:hypothetical protein
MGFMVGDVVIVVGGKAEASPKPKQKASHRAGKNTYQVFGAFERGDTYYLR